MKMLRSSALVERRVWSGRNEGRGGWGLGGWGGDGEESGYLGNNDWGKEFLLTCALFPVRMTSSHLTSPISSQRRSLGHHRWFCDQFPQFFSVLHCPQGLGELQACPFLDVVFPPLPLSALSSSPFHFALQDGFGRTWWTGDMSIPLQLASLYDGQEVFVWSDCLLPTPIAQSFKVRACKQRLQDDNSDTLMWKKGHRGNAWSAVSSRSDTLYTVCLVYVCWPLIGP